MPRPIRSLALTALAPLALAGSHGPAAAQVPADSGASIETRSGSEGPDRTRLFLSSTARPLHRGEGFVVGHLLLFPIVAYGVTDALTVAAGASLFPGSIGRSFYVAPKLTLVNRTRLDLAIGSHAILLEEGGGLGALYKDQGGLLGALYGMGTFRGSRHAVTAGAGWGYRLPNSRINATFQSSSRGSHLDLERTPIVLLALQSQPVRPFAMLTENWFGYRDGQVHGLLSGGVRSFGRAGSVDLAVAMRVERGQTWFPSGRRSRVECCIPVVNFTLYFGR